MRPKRGFWKTSTTRTRDFLYPEQRKRGSWLVETTPLDVLMCCGCDLALSKWPKFDVWINFK